MQPIQPSAGVNQLIQNLSYASVFSGAVSKGDTTIWATVTPNPDGTLPNAQSLEYEQDNTNEIMLRIPSYSGPQQSQNYNNSFSASNTATTITHALGRTPIGYYVVQKSKACDVYDGDVSAWNSNTISLCITDASAEITLVVF